MGKIFDKHVTKEDIWIANKILKRLLDISTDFEQVL